MKRSSFVLLLIFVLYGFQSFAGIRFVEGKSWKEVLAMAKQQNKLIFLDAYATWCGPCKYLQKNVFTDKEVGDYYNAHFINVKMDMEEGEGIELAETLGVGSYPTLFFINGDGKVVHKTVGAMDAADFITLGETAFNPDLQFYTVKEKAAKGALSPEAFHNWMHTAADLDDEDLDEITNNYIKRNQYPVLQLDMLRIIMDHKPQVSKAQLDEIYKNRVASAKKMEASQADFDAALLKLVVRYAETAATKKGAVDFDAYKAAITTYFPKQAALETQKRKVTHYLEAEDAKALSTLSDLVRNQAYALRVKDMASLIVDAGMMITRENKGKEWIQQINAYTVRAEDKSEAYYKDVTIAMLYYYMEDDAGFGRTLEKLEKDPNIPPSILQFLQSKN